MTAAAISVEVKGCRFQKARKEVGRPNPSRESSSGRREPSGRRRTARGFRHSQIRPKSPRHQRSTSALYRLYQIDGAERKKKASVAQYRNTPSELVASLPSSILGFQGDDSSSERSDSFGDLDQSSLVRSGDVGVGALERLWKRTRREKRVSLNLVPGESAREAREAERG